MENCRILFFGLVLFFKIFLTNSQKSFAETKFDLNPNLPFEDPVPVLGSIDAPTNVEEKSVVNDAKPAVIENAPLPNPPQPTNIQLPQPPAPQQQAPTQPLFPPSPSFVSLQPRPLSIPTPPPQQIFSPGGGSSFGPGFSTIVFSQSPLTVLPPHGVTQPPPPSPVQKYVTHAAVAVARPIEVVRENSFRDRADLWFSDNYDLRACPHNIDFISEKFKQKFPRNLLKRGKETVLADLLATRLKECIKKQARNEWERTESLISQLEFPISEKDECRSGLVQEQISCFNVQSYACQFIQRNFHFRLVPARLIVQEARLAEDGAEKCKRISKMVRKQLEKLH